MSTTEPTQPIEDPDGTETVPPEPTTPDEPSETPPLMPEDEIPNAE